MRSASRARTSGRTFSATSRRCGDPHSTATLGGPVSSNAWSGLLRPELAVSLNVHIGKCLTSRCLLCAALIVRAVAPVVAAGQDVAGAPPVITTPKKQPPKQEKLPEDL